MEKRAALQALAFSVHAGASGGAGNEIRLEALLRFPMLEPDNEEWLSTLLVAADGDAKQILEELISNPGEGPRERRAFVRLVDRFRLGQAHGALLQLALDNPGETYAGQAVRALLKDRESREELSGRLMEPTEAGDALALIKLLQEAQDARAGPMLLQFIQSGG